MSPAHAGMERPGHLGRDDTDFQAAALNAYSWSLSKLPGRADEALDPARRGLDLALRVGDADSVAAAHDTLAEVHAARGDRETALASHRSALEVYERIGYRARIEQVRASISAIAG